MTYRAPSPADGVQMETFIPWTLVKRSVRRGVITPLDAPGQFTQEAVQERRERQAAQDTPLMRAVGLAHHWQRLLDVQLATSIGDIAEAEGIHASQVRRLLRFVLWSPMLIECLAANAGTSLEWAVRQSWPGSWDGQMRLLRLKKIGATSAKEQSQSVGIPMCSPAGQLSGLPSR